jgi:fructose-1,6-bisphosphatase/inositol monophosphatase family enzyme
MPLMITMPTSSPIPPPDNRALFKRLCAAIQVAGIVARTFRSRVPAEHKPGRLFEDDSPELVTRRSLKTAVDDAIQEILLAALSEIFDPSDVLVDAEENTPSLGLFRLAPPASLTVVLDPLDGTAQYLSGSPLYSICVGVFRVGKPLVVIVYFPSLGSLYAAVAADSQALELIPTSDGVRPERIGPPARHRRVIYYNARVPGGYLSLLSGAGYDPIQDTSLEGGAPSALRYVATGEALAYVAHSRQLRDLLLGVIFSEHDHFAAVDWTGAPLVWPDGGRVPRALFVSKQHSEEVVAILSRLIPLDCQPGKSAVD